MNSKGLKSNQAIEGSNKGLETADLEGIDFSDWDDTKVEGEPAKVPSVESNDGISAEALWRSIEEEMDDRDDGELEEEVEKD
ncbi:hypothetical protein BGW38_010329, partial [Lunasporangiospora selenospora]